MQDRSPARHRTPDGRASEDLRQAAAVDDERGAGDVAAGVAGEEQGRADQLFGLAPAAQGGCAGEFVLLLLRRAGSAGRSVRNGPGAMQLTVMPKGPRSLALARARPRSALLVAE